MSGCIGYEPTLILGTGTGGVTRSFPLTSSTLPPGSIRSRERLRSLRNDKSAKIDLRKMNRKEKTKKILVNKDSTFH